MLLPRPWWIAEYDSPALLTSDEPVALHFRDRSRPAGHDRGIAHADELPQQRLRPAAQTAVTVNRTIAAGAYEHIYMHPAQDHLKRVRLPRPGPVLKVSGDLPVDLGRYNKPVASTRTQRRR